jgi:hypothetical protein
MPGTATATAPEPSGAPGPLVVDFATLDANSLPLAGGKAVNLVVHPHVPRGVKAHTTHR